MRTLYRRQLALAGVAVLGVVAVLAAGRLRHAGAALPAAEGSYRAFAGVMRAGAVARPTDCRVRLTRDSEAIENPVLPCGIRLYVRYRGRTVLASVVGHGPVPVGRAFDLTPALARGLRLTGVRPVVWSYAGVGSVP
jgi:hypothetical protein